MIQFDGVVKAFGGEQIFRGLNWQIPTGATLGLVGPNGAGKTTLFRLIAQEETADHGRVIRPRGIEVGYLPQEMDVAQDGTVLDVILRGKAELLELERRIRDLEQQMAEQGGDLELAQEYGEVQDRFRRQGGYEFRSRARGIAAGIGFADDECDREIAKFSGGWRMRALLARLLFRRPDLLLLDEPTNHLDVESIEWLEQFLNNYDGTVLIISHDRYFLNRLVDGIAELHAGKIGTYDGDYDHYLVEREVRRERLIEARAQQEKERAQIQEFIDRFRYKATKAAQVQSRIKYLERMEEIEVPPDYGGEIRFEFPKPPRVGKSVVVGRDLSKRYGDLLVYENVDFQLHRGDKVAFVGPNGAGKSTLLKMLAGVLAPDTGEVELGHQVEISYFAQHSVDQLDLSQTVLGEMDASASYDAAPRIRSILGAFLFSGDDVAKPISVLSGGEKSRLALAKMLLEPAGCLLLDEPTNHLDIASRQVLEHALKTFDGAFCVISHDRYFLNEVVNRVIHIEDGALIDYPGSYEEYRWRRKQEENRQQSEQLEPNGQGGQSSEKLSRREIRQLMAELRQEKAAKTGDLRAEVSALEERVIELEANLEEVENTLAQPETHQNASADKIVSLQKQHSALEGALMEAMEEWEKKGVELNEMEREFVAREEELRSV